MKLSKLLALLAATGFAALLIAIVVVAVAYNSFSKQLPEIDTSTDFALEVPLRIYTADNKLIAEYGTQLRTPVTYEQIPQVLIDAFLAAEDDRFFEHPGVDWQGLLRAVGYLIMTGERGQGGSTITMQLARNFFLSPEKSYKRKVLEIMLAIKMEQKLSKQEILTLYLNKIYLGKRAYGIAAAAQVYYGKPLEELTVAQAAMIAGLPKAPSRYNPIANSRRALQRRNYVLRRMNELGTLDTASFEQAKNEDVSAELTTTQSEVEANYVAEMVRGELVKRFGNDVYSSGYQVHTTIDSAKQNAAVKALRNGLQAYDQRHGWRGAEEHYAIDELVAKAQAAEENQGITISTETALQEQLDNTGRIGDLIPAIVTRVQGQTATVEIREFGTTTLNWDALKWARRYINTNSIDKQPSSAKEILKVGDLVRVRNTSSDENKPNWLLAQVPQAQGAIVAFNPNTGGLDALVGGYYYYNSKFNRATQSRRQPGSSFKPFLYSAALEKGYTAATIINDAPVVFEDAKLETTWRPENYSGKFFGPTRLRWGLTHSRNMISIRLVQDIGVRYAIDYAGRFGLNTYNIPNDLSMSLGSGVVSPYELGGAYTVFANGGYRVKTHFIDRITNSTGKLIWASSKTTICKTACANAELAAAIAAEEAALREAALPNESTPADNSEQQAQYEPPADSTAEYEAPKPIPADRVISAENAWIMNSMLQDVVQYGTAKKARSLGRQDIAGKTGTTNDQKDAWFAGFNRNQVAVAWVGFDEVASLGRAEVGGRAALPVWIDFMQVALKGVAENPLPQPEGMVTVRINKNTGERADAGDPDSLLETFRAENTPKASNPYTRNPYGDRTGSGNIVEELF